MNHPITCKQTADYFGLDSIYNLSSSVVIVPTAQDSDALAEHLYPFVPGCEVNPYGVSIGRGNFRGEKLSVMVCGDDPFIAAMSMKAAKHLRFKNAFYFGRAYSTDDVVGNGELIVPMNVYQYRIGKRLGNRWTKNNTNLHLMEALENALESTNLNFLETDTHTTGDYPADLLKREMLYERGQICLDDKLILVLGIAKDNRTRTAALMVVEDEALNYDLSSTGIPLSVARSISYSDVEDVLEDTMFAFEINYGPDDDGTGFVPDALKEAAEQWTEVNPDKGYLNWTRVGLSSEHEESDENTGHEYVVPEIEAYEKVYGNGQESGEGEDSCHDAFGVILEAIRSL